MIFDIQPVAGACSTINFWGECNAFPKKVNKLACKKLTRKAMIIDKKVLKQCTILNYNETIEIITAIYALCFIFSTTNIYSSRISPQYIKMFRESINSIKIWTIGNTLDMGKFVVMIIDSFNIIS